MGLISYGTLSLHFILVCKLCFRSSIHREVVVFPNGFLAGNGHIHHRVHHARCLDQLSEIPKLLLDLTGLPVPVDPSETLMSFIPLAFP